jgi:hypothetical protein
MVCSALQGKGLSSRLCGGPFGGAIGYLGKTPDQMIVTVAQSFPLYWPWLGAAKEITYFLITNGPHG